MNRGTAKPPAAGPAVKVSRLSHAAGLPLPAYQTPGSAGLDLQAAVAADMPLFIAPGERVAIPTGLMFELPAGHEAQVRPRSGLALKHGLTVLNAPGTIDSDYRGEVQVILINLSLETATVRRGDRIAQLVVAPVTQVSLVEATSLSLSATSRGAGGFGSTGIAAIAEEATPPKKRQKKKPVPAKRPPGAKRPPPVGRDKRPRAR